jgi:hypothetical protein
LSKRLGFLKNEALLSIELKVAETEKVLNGLIKSLKKDCISLCPSAFSLQPKKPGFLL